MLNIDEKPCGYLSKLQELFYTQAQGQTGPFTVFDIVVKDYFRSIQRPAAGKTEPAKGLQRQAVDIVPVTLPCYTE